MLQIRPADGPDDMQSVRELFQEYAASLDIDLCFQAFEEELATLPGKYAPPAGRLLLAVEDAEKAGCVALRPIGDGIAEMKRLYVRPAFRGRGVGRLLIAALLDESKQAGYTRVRLDTLPSMGAAITLYRSFGFYDIPPQPGHAVPGTLFLERRLP
jgi:putative acetyltransferase